MRATNPKVGTHYARLGGNMRKFLAAALAACGLLLWQTTAYAKSERIVFVGHWPESDSFFNVIRNSAQLAADQLGVKVEFRNPPGGDLSEMGRLIDQATASKPAAIISTVPDESIVDTPLTNAVSAGIPVVIVNSGSAEIAKKVGALHYIGQAEYEAGKAAGDKAKAQREELRLCQSLLSAPGLSPALPGLRGWAWCQAW
jgi:simple sugar transport system substrate-binding protein